MPEPIWTRPSEPAASAPRSWSGLPMIDCFRRAVERWPDTVFVEDGALRLTYADADRAVCRLARDMTRNTPPDRPIAAMVDNGAAYTVAMLACAASGRAVVQVDLAAPADRQAVILREAGVGAVVALEGTSIDPAAVPDEVPRLFFDARIEGDAPALPEMTRDADAVFTISFTSGSTGNPKGIAFSQNQLLSLASAYADHNGIGPDAVLVSLASVSPASVRDACATLLSGATLRYVDLKRLGLTRGIGAWREAGATHLTFVTSAMRMLAPLPGVAAAMSSIRVLSLIGEATTAEDIALFRARLPADGRIALGLGSTEAGTVCRWFVDDARIDGGVAPSGYIEANRAVAILDDDGLPVPVGGIGELVVSDAGVALGYWRARRLTDSFPAGAGDPGPRTCRTGDMVRLREDGLVEHVGRRDRMLKVRGLRVDLGEVEAALRALPAIDDAAIVATRDAGDDTVLTAFVLWAAGTEPMSTADLRRHVARETAEHMVPHAFRVVEEFPRLYNGKPDLVLLAGLAARPA